MKEKLVSYIRNLCIRKRVAIIGFGKEGISTYNLLRSVFSEIRVFVVDKNAQALRDKFVGDKVVFLNGSEADFDLNHFDVVFKSPGVPAREFGISRLMPHVQLTSQTQIILELFSEKIIGITGTKGKSTTTTLLHEIVRAAGFHVVIAGNIGLPFFDIFETGDNPIDYFVCEFSSHQLQTIAHSPHFSILLNIYEDHLDYYESYSDYQRAKFNIFEHQQGTDFCVFNRDSDILLKEISSKRRAFTILSYTLESSLPKMLSGCYLKDRMVWYTYGSISEPVLNVDDIRFLKGDHNIQNIMAAICISKLLNIENSLMQKVISEFQGLPHRMQLVAEINHVKFYNDSISTIPEATIYSIQTLGNVGTIIIGGKDRGINYNKLVEFLLLSDIDNIVLLGEVGQKLYPQILAKRKFGKIHRAENMEDVIAYSLKETPEGKACLLSPAAASFGMFRDFQERGDIFVKLLRKAQYDSKKS